MDVLNMYEDLSVSIWPQSQFTEINFCFKTISCKYYISISLPIFVLKEKYNIYYNKKCRNVTSPSSCQLFLQDKIALRSPLLPHPTKKADKSRDRSESISTWQVSKITKYSWKKWIIEDGEIIVSVSTNILSRWCFVPS